MVAFAGHAYLGGAYGRLYTAEDHGHGYLDPDTPEIAVGVEPEHRGKMLGGRLLRALEDVATERGVERLSLSVESENRAVRLYERLGYEVVDRDSSAVRMVRTLPR